jgi:hypothetical protein
LLIKKAFVCLHLLRGTCLGTAATAAAATAAGVRLLLLLPGSTAFDG